MKKTLLLGLLVLSGLTATAQVAGDGNPLADGSIAPDFTTTDINGETHSLYADYLDQGKSVIIDFSATWCGPCWNYHQTHAMADLYEAYGPEGSDEVMVIFVEGDVANTTTENIYGEQGPIAMSQGNWTIGSPYPIIEDTEELDLGNASNYDVDYFPTMYLICPETYTTTSVDQNTATQLRNKINANCQTLVGIPNHGMITPPAAEIRVCENGATATVTGKLKNFGNNPITNAVVVLKENGNVVGTKNYTGNLNQFATAASIGFNNVVINAGSTYTMELTSLNGGPAANPELTTANVAVSVAEQAASNMVEVRVHTDNYPSEASWQIKNSAGQVVATGGPYEPGDEDEWGGGGPDSNTMISQWVTLPGDAPECHSVVLKDAFQDGWSLGSTPHGIEIYSNGELVYEKWVGNFGATSTNPSAFRSSGVLETPTMTSEKFAIYPNPSTGVFNFRTQEEVAVTVMDITGKVVFTAKGINDGASINLSALQSGVYIAKINGASAEKIEKLVIK